MSNSYLIFIGSLKKGGVERFAALLANDLVENGHKVKLLMINNEITFPLDERVDLKIIGYKKNQNKLAKILKIYFNLFFTVWSTKPKRLITLARLSGLFASSTFYPKTMVMFDIYPLIGYKRYKQWQFWIFYNLPWVKYVVSCSQELKDDVQKYFIYSKKIKVIPYPVPKINPEYLVDKALNNRPYFIVLSRLNSQKNVDQVIKAFSKYEIYKSADLLILGDGPEMENLKELTETENLKEYIKFKGFIRNPYDYIAQAKCLINASTREGFPNVLIESLGLETPVLSSLAKTGPKEIIFDGENGLVFKVGDYNKLGQYMIRVLNDDELYTHLKKNVRKGIDRYTHEKIMNKWSKLLDS